MSECQRTAIELAGLCVVIHKSLVQSMEQKLQQHNVSVTTIQMGLMRQLRHEALTISDLSRRFHLDPSTLVPMVDALEEKGYLTRGRDPNDRRRIPLSLTPQGQQILKQYGGIDSDSAICAAVDALDATSRRQLLQLMRDLIRHLPDGHNTLAHLDDRLQAYDTADHHDPYN